MLYKLINDFANVYRHTYHIFEKEKTKKFYIKFIYIYKSSCIYCSYNAVTLSADSFVKCKFKQVWIRLVLINSQNVLFNKNVLKI